MLNQRQELFCINYVSGMTATEAAIKAGYTNPSANISKILKNTGIQERLAILNAPLAVRASSTKEAKLQVLEDIYTHKPLPDQITARDRIGAVTEHNKMEKVYSDIPVTQDNRTINIFIQGGEEAKKELKLLMSGKEE